MEIPIPEIYKKLWSDWEIRIFVLSSLTLQILLIYLASLRKRTAKRTARLAIWSFYLLADWVADFALGLLSNSQGNSSGSSSSSTSSSAVHSLAATGSSSKRGPTSDINSNVILAFWAPFLLLHLGGPDTITAFALEDNELWLRHLLGLGFELFAAGYVFFRSLPDNRLLAPTLVMFLVGMIKYGERTYSLYRASSDGFRDSILTEPDPGPNYAKLMEEYDSKLKANLQAEIDIDRTKPPEEKEEERDPAEITKAKAIDPAYKFYDTFRRLFVDLILSFSERTVSRNYFIKCSANEAFRVIEVELNFVYDQLYTKAPVIHTRHGYVLRFIGSAALITAFLLFFFTDKIGFNHIDVAISYTLLWGAICLDASAIVFLIFSDWTVVFLKEYSRTLYLWLARIVAYVKVQRWSGKMSQFNLLGYCLGIPMQHRWWLPGNFGWLQKISENLCFKEMLDDLVFTMRKGVDEELRTFMFDRLKKKADEAKDYKSIREVCERRGAKYLKECDCLDKERKWEDVEFDESLLLWHIATDLCYFSKDGEGKGSRMPSEEDGRPADHNQPGNLEETAQANGLTVGSGIHEEDDGKAADQNQPESPPNSKELSKLLSDYMLYLLVMQPAMMSTMAGIGLIRYRDTCAEVKRFFAMSEQKPNQDEACKMLLKVNTSVPPAAVKGDRSKSVLFDACILAKKLNDMTEEKRWTMIIEAWEELLSYAASHCRGNAHARQLSKGGELLTLIWLLMAHLGLGEQYRIEAGHARAKLVVDM